MANVFSLFSRRLCPDIVIQLAFGVSSRHAGWCDWPEGHDPLDVILLEVVLRCLNGIALRRLMRFELRVILGAVWLVVRLDTESIKRTHRLARR